MKKFTPELIENAITQSFPQLYIGRITASNELLMSPVSNKPCVFYEVVAEELVQGQNNEKNWFFRFKETKAADFFLADPRTSKKIFVKGTASNVIKVSRVTEETKTGFNASLWQHENIPPHLQVNQP